MTQDFLPKNAARQCVLADVRHFMVMLAALVFGGGCDKASLQEKGASSLRGSTVKDLVTSESAPAFLPGNAAVTEVVQVNGSWEFYHDKELAALARAEPAAFEAFREAREKAALEGVSSRIIVSAGAGTRFKELRRLARGAFDSGYDRLDFLVRGSATADEQRAFYLEFPTAVGSFVPPDIEPKLVKIDFDGAISVNAAASLIPLDRAGSDSSLPLLNEDLLSYAAAARAAASTPVVQILVDGDATYQRWMDVMARCHANGFTRVLVVDVNMDTETTCQGMTCPPANRGSGHLPVAPSPDRLATQFPIGTN